MNLKLQIKRYNAIYCKMNELYHEWCKAHGMSYNTMMTIYALHQCGKCSQKQIADDWLIPKQTVNTVVKDLEKRRFIRFESLPDGRRKTVCFTDAGKAFAENSLRGLHEIESRAMASLGEDACETYLQLCAAHLQAFEREVHNHE